MERNLDSELNELKNHVLTMGGFVEKAINDAVSILTSRETSVIESINASEAQINQAQMTIDGLCLTTLARQSPLASDLRLILAIIKINNDLERMGDLAKNIAYNSRRYIKGTPVDIANALPAMAQAVKQMVRNGLDAFVRRDLHLAQSVLQQDDQIDTRKEELFGELVAHMKIEPAHIESALTLILIVRSLERLGDHATNVAEDAIFAITGEDVRHRGD